MYTYVQQPGCKKENTAMYVYIRVGSQTPTRAYVRPGLVYMAGSERRNSIVVVFMGRQRNASCSWGGNRMHRVHGEATERVGDNRLGRNGMCGRVHREGLVGTGDGNQAWRTTQRRKRTSYVRNRVLFIGRGLAYRKTEETDLLRSKQGSCSSGGVWRTAKQTKRTCAGALRSKRGSCSSGGVWRTAKRDSMGYCSSPPSTPSNLHELLFIHRRPPPASTCDCSSMGSCSSSLHHALLHRLLFNQPSPWAPVQPPLHGLLFILPSTGWSCSSNPPRVLFI